MRVDYAGILFSGYKSANVLDKIKITYIKYLADIASILGLGFFASHFILATESHFTANERRTLMKADG